MFEGLHKFFNSRKLNELELLFLKLTILSHEDKEPDEIIKNKNGDYLHRWFIIKDREIGNVYLHRFLGDDDDRALHDHPWESVSFVIEGKYYEHLKDGGHLRQAGDFIQRDMTTPHRVELIGEECWTLFITGPRKRDWGFDCPDGWKNYLEFQEDDGC